MAKTVWDPRWSQALSLGTFLMILTVWGQGPDPLCAATAVLVGLAAQMAGTLVRVAQTGKPQPWQLPSALITSLSLSLLLRTQHWQTMALAATLAIASKFLVRTPHKHLFNPANFGIVLTLGLTGDAWLASGQWGAELWLGILFVSAGAIVLGQVGRWETSGAFLLGYGGLTGMRYLWLGESGAAWLHHVANGSLLVFALFMLSDPRTVPDRPVTRVLWALAIALLTFILRDGWYLPDGAFYALFALSPTVALWDRWQPGSAYIWPQLEYGGQR
ncbi:MAG: Na+-transporting NADH:ubiquinone oxidoreductase, subunit NqrB [Oscillatoriales cyanobacterium SM2_1_8]|nr:Na+-transporting NADH:ubiquinone oxidoreductase, subunit NqrB [Oscillatoriales cyanobacterium SM2_1_8]